MIIEYFWFILRITIENQNFKNKLWKSEKGELWNYVVRVDAVQNLNLILEFHALRIHFRQCRPHYFYLIKNELVKQIYFLFAFRLKRNNFLSVHQKLKQLNFLE